MEQTSWVHKLGADKYGPWNWRETGVCASTYVNAILRHLNAWRDGEDLDPESGITHLAHIACSANILMDAEVCGKLQDDRNKRPTNDETEEGSPKVGSSLEDMWRDGEEDALAEFIEDMWREIDKDTEAGFEDDWAEAGYRLLKEGEELQDGDDVYVGEGQWYPLYIASWATPASVNGGTYRRKITDCDLKEEPSIKYRVETTAYRKLEEGDKLQDGDEVYVGEDHWLPVYVSDWMTPSIVRNGTYRRKITNCDLKDKVADCDLEEESPIDDECICGRRKVYHWLYGYICEDCDLKSHDSYYP
jgi:hypothetical protein